MTGQEALALLIGMLDRENLPYMVVGSFRSCGIHGTMELLKKARAVAEG